MLETFSDLCRLLRGRGRRARQECWGLGLWLETLGVLAEAVGLARVLVLAVGNLQSAPAF